MNLPRRTFLRLTAGSAALPVVARRALAQTYPSRPVHWIVAASPSGGNDIFARLIGQWLSERLGQPFVVENRPGASNNIGTEAVVRAPPDGYMLLLTSSNNASNAALYRHLSFDFIRDITPVAGIARTTLVMVLNPSIPAKTVPEFVSYAKANPGKVNMGSAGIGGIGHLAGEFFMMMTGARGCGGRVVPLSSLGHRVHQSRQVARARGHQRDTRRCNAGASEHRRVCARL
jgi:tripartite-type tricarboxylate transporter receptor subunit TctC